MNSIETNTVNPEQAWSLIKSGATLIDVRTAAEFDAGHLPGAKNIPHDHLAHRLNELDLSSEDNIVLYCKSGGRSDFAMKVMQNLGFKRAVNAGGYEELMHSKK